MSTMLAVSELEYDVDGDVARLTINRPDRRNAMSLAVLQGLDDALARARDDASVRVVVLTGAGTTAFCAGADLSAMGDGEGVVAAHAGRGLLPAVFRRLWTLGKPTIARVRGYALAGGFGLAMSCDVVIAAEDAQFGTPEINIGLWPYMITVPLLRAMTPRVALELMLTGRRVDAHEAKELGFVNRVVPVDELDSTIDALAAELAAKSPLVMQLGRDSFYRVIEMRSDEALEYLQSQLTITSLADDAAEGVRAFLEKRPAQWRGR